VTALPADPAVVVAAGGARAPGVWSSLEALLPMVAGPPVRGLLRLPAPVKRRLAGKPVVVDGLTLDTDMQLLRRLYSLAPAEAEDPTVEFVRAGLANNTRALRGQPVPGVHAAPVTLLGRLPARSYTPAGLPRGSALLVYFHGGGWVAGSLDSHDNLCRFLAAQAGIRVLAVDYRLAPEAPFPAAVDDAVGAYHCAVRNAERLGADPALVGVGGDSAGGGLAITVSHQTALAGEGRPAFALAIYPAVDFSARRRSRELFGTGFFLTDAMMTWFERHYLGGWADKTDVRMSPLLADDLSGLPPTHIVTAGFDPLRDEGEELAARLEQAGVPVTLRRYDGLVHGFASMFNASPSARAATVEVAAALAGLTPAGQA
jgi:acetyl esterase